MEACCVLQVGSVCNNAQVRGGKVLGHPTECAIPSPLPSLLPLPPPLPVILACCVLQVGSVCNNAQVRGGKVLGHPTECAILSVSHKVRLDQLSNLLSKYY